MVQTGTISGTVTGNTAAGQITFSSLRILTSGTFSIRASCTNMISATSASTTITNYVYSITLAASTTTPSMNFDFTITATLKSEDNALYKAASVTVSLAESTSSLSGTTSAGSVTTTGISTLTVYCSSIGAKTIVASVPASSPFTAVTQSIAVTVQTLILVLGTFSTTVIIK